MSKNKFIYALVCASILFQTSSVNADIKDAHAYRSAKEYQDAYKEYVNVVKNFREKEKKESLAEADKESLALAMLILGHMHSNGNGIDQDYKQAFEWYKKSAEKGNAQAMTNVSDLYFYSCNIDPGHPVDVEKALEWRKKSAAAGYEYAKKNGVPSLEVYIKNKKKDLINDATGYQSGRYAAKECNNRVAMKEWEKAANKGDINSMLALASRYQTGVKGIVRDYSKAIKWFNKIKEKSVDLELIDINTARVARVVSKKARRPPKAKVVYKDNPATRDVMKYLSETEPKKMMLEISKSNLNNWSKGLFNSIFNVYKYTEFSNYDENVDIREQRFTLHGQRIVKKIWIRVERQLDKKANIISCEITKKSSNLLGEDIVGSDCRIKDMNNKTTLLDKVIGYFW